MIEIKQFNTVEEYLADPDVIVATWNLRAQRIAETVCAAMHEAHRGVYQADGFIVVFGNDSHDEDERTQRQVALLREFLENEDIEILGFSTDPDGYAWAMLVDHDDIDLLSDALWSACFNAWMGRPGASRDNVAMYCHERRAEADSIIERFAAESPQPMALA